MRYNVPCTVITTLFVITYLYKLRPELLGNKHGRGTNILPFLI